MSVVPELDEASNAFAALGVVLWRERELLDRLHYRLVAQWFVVDAGAWHWLAASDEDVREVVVALRHCEVERMARSEELATAFGLTPDATLAALAAVAPQPWPGILADHRAALRQVEQDLQAVMDESLVRIRVAFDDDVAAPGRITRGAQSVNLVPDRSST